MVGLAGGEFATAILAELDGGTLRWSNAGHLPPAVLGPCDCSRRRPSRCSGSAPSGARTTSRSSSPASLERLHELGADAICDRLLAQLGSRRDDDVALLVARS